MFVNKWSWWVSCLIWMKIWFIVLWYVCRVICFLLCSWLVIGFSGDFWIEENMDCVWNMVLIFFCLMMCMRYGFCALISCWLVCLKMMKWCWRLWLLLGKRLLLIFGEMFVFVWEYNFWKYCLKCFLLINW